MSKGHIFLAQNSEVNYVTQAYLLALSIKSNNKINQTCLITNNTVPPEFEHVFDYVQTIPWDDKAKDSLWKIENRWKIIHVSPFKENIVYDTDMLVLSSNDHWWNVLKNKDVVLTSEVKDYRNNIINNDTYRKTFTDYSLPNVYMGIHYFKKTKKAYEFYKWLEIITNNYKDFYDKFLPNAKQKFCSMDLNAALAVLFMDAFEEFTIKNNPMTFTHMKSRIQSWDSKHNKWQDAVNSFINNDGNLNVGNYLQTGVFHYTEKDFVNVKIMSALREKYDRAS